MLLTSVTSVLSILAFSRLASGLQLRQQGLHMLTSSAEFDVYRNAEDLYPNETEIKYDHVGFGVAAFEVDAGLNFSLFCTGPRHDGPKLVWTSNSFQFYSEVILGQLCSVITYGKILPFWIFLEGI